MRHLLVLLSIVCTPLVAADWVETTHFTAGTGPAQIFSRGDQVVAWNVAKLWSSTDGGRSWAGPSSPVAQAGGTPIGITTAVIAANATYVLAADGTLWVIGGGAMAPTGGRAVGLAVDGAGTAWAQDLAGTVAPLPAGQPKVSGTLYIGAKSGVVVQRGKDLVLATTSGERQLKTRLENGPPAAAGLAPVASGGGDSWLTREGGLWEIYGGSGVHEASARPIEVLSTAWKDGGFHECIRYQGRIGIYRPGAGGRQLHVRTEGAPQDTVAMALTRDGILMLTATGFWRADY